MSIPFINDFLKIERKKRGITQEKFAEMIFKSIGTVKRYDTGDTIPESVLWQSCEVLDLDFIKLLNTQRLIYIELHDEGYIRLADTPYCNLIRKYGEKELIKAGFYNTVFSLNYGLKESENDTLPTSKLNYDINTLKSELNNYLDLKNNILNIPNDKRKNKEKIDKILSFIDFLYFDDIIKK